MKAWVEIFKILFLMILSGYPLGIIGKKQNASQSKQVHFSG
jgi:hypothetical protein